MADLMRSGFVRDDTGALVVVGKNGAAVGGGGPFSIDVTAAPYNAKGDAKFVSDAAITATQTALTSAQAAFTIADAGKVVLLQGAGVAGADLRTTIASVAGGVATLSVAASTTVATKAAVYGTDDTVALQAAIDAAANAGGGILKLHGGRYIVDGPLKTAPTVGNVAGHIYRTQLALPSIDMITADKVEIVIRGDLPQGRTHGFAGFGGAAAPRWSSRGTAIISTGMGGSWDAVQGWPSLLGGPNMKSTGTLGGTQIGGFTNVYVTVENVTFVSPQNPSYLMCDFYGVASASVTDSNYEVLGMLSTAAPSNPTGQALVMPHQANNFPHKLDRIYVNGYYGGLSPGEHTDIGTVGVDQTMVAFSVQDQTLAGGHAISAKKLITAQCPYVFAYADPSTGITACKRAVWFVDNCDIENQGGGNGPAWAASIAHLWDTGNLKGRIGYMIPATNANWTITGAVVTTNLIDHNLVGTRNAATLINSYVQYDATKTPAWSKDANGIVRLHGGVISRNVAVQAMFQLPVRARPGGNEYLNFVVFSTTAAGATRTQTYVQVAPDGTVYILNAIAAGELIEFTGVHFKATA